MTAGMLHEAASPCPTCNGTGVLAEPVEERFGGYIDGPEPAARTWVVHVGGASGLGVAERKSVRLFSERFRIRERDALRDMEDGLLMEHVGRLRRILVMADEDNLPDWYVDLTRKRHAMATDDLRWRQRAMEKGGDRIAAQIAWRERVDRLRGAIDLGWLIAHENDGAQLLYSGNWKCCCPFHADRAPSLDIDIAKGVWICRVCNVGGDAFTYVEMRYGLDFAEAVRHLEQRL
jgi:hypothetical protein